MNSTKIKRGRLRRINSEEFAEIGEALRHAILNMKPDEFTQRKTVAMYLPQLYELRTQGYTFKKLAELVSECGTNIAVDTLRIYYNEMLPERLDECQGAISQIPPT